MKAWRRPVRERARPRGYSLFELAVAAVIITLLTSMLLKRLHFYQQEAELVAVRQLIGTLRTALSVRNAQLSVAHKEHLLRKVIDENPISWLVHPPSNYLGEYYSPRVNALTPGNWYFDRGDNTLVYLLQPGKTFMDDRPILLRFKVKFLDSSLLSGKPSGQPGVIKGVVLDEVDDHNAGK